jgi:hypothetical protein
MKYRKIRSQTRHTPYPKPHTPYAPQRGFTLLIAALVASIVLALGTSIYQIATKQVQLSSIGRDSQFAFYAADTAAECALYWDFRFSYFATVAPSGVEDPTCDGESLQATGRSQTYPYTMTSQPMNMFSDASPGGGYCGAVTVTKSLDASTGAVRTVIHADGYNVRCTAIGIAPQALQRSVELHY